MNFTADDIKSGISQFVEFIINLVNMIKKFVAGFKGHMDLDKDKVDGFTEAPVQP